MKIVDYANLQAAINYKVESSDFDIRAERDKYKERGLSDMRFRWDILHWSGADISGFYKYLSDDHIDTALRKIADELLNS